GAIIKVRKGTITGEGWFDPDLGAFVEIDDETDLTLDIAARQRNLTQQFKENIQVTLQGITSQ
ncbi:MAG: hypothetical protein ACREE6_05970, partial [Limisphaerales bacterium]